MTPLELTDTAPGDPELIARARAGSDEAYTELWERHKGAGRAAARALTRSRATADDLVAEGFTRTLAVLRSGGGPEVAFRPYLLATIRNAYRDRNRRDEHVEFMSDVTAAVPAGAVVLLDTAAEAVVDDEERARVASAYAGLPERWQLVLWHVAVEGRAPAEVSPLLGLAPNAVAALAYRAREGLRKAYLQAHLRSDPGGEHRFTIERLGAYVRDGVSPKDRAIMDEHLAGCVPCTAMLAELRDVDVTLRRALVPLIVGVAPGAYLKAVGAGVVARPPGRATAAKVALATAAAATFVAVGFALLRDDDRDRVATVAGTTTTLDIDGPTTTARSTVTSRRSSTSTNRSTSTTFPPSSPTVVPSSTVFRPTPPAVGTVPTSTSGPPPSSGRPSTTVTTVARTTTTVRTTTTQRTNPPATNPRPTTTTTTVPPSTIDPNEDLDRGDPPDPGAPAPPPATDPPVALPERGIDMADTANFVNDDEGQSTEGTLEVAVTNTTPVALTDVVVAFADLRDVAVIAQPAGAGLTCDPTGPSCTIKSLPAGQSVLRVRFDIVDGRTAYVAGSIVIDNQAAPFSVTILRPAG